MCLSRHNVYVGTVYHEENITGRLDDQRWNGGNVHELWKWYKAKYFSSFNFVKSVGDLVVGKGKCI